MTQPTPTKPGLTSRERTKLIAEAFRHGWPFKVHPNGAIELTPPTMQASTDPFDLVDMRR